MGEIFTRLIKMPSRIKGYTAIDDDGNYNIYLNEQLSQEQQRKTYLHEMAHIARGDWDKASVEDAEKDIQLLAQLKEWSLESEEWSYGKQKQ